MSVIRVVIVLLYALLLACDSSSGDKTGQKEAESAAKPQLRLVTLAPHLAELVFAAGAGDGLLGVVKYTDYPPEAALVPLIGDAFRVDYEEIMRLSPDVVLAWDGGTPNEVIEYLRNLGFDVSVLRSLQLTDIPDQVEQLGLLAGTSAVAAASAAKMRASLQRLRESYGNLPPAKVFLQIAVRPFYTITSEHILNDAISMCGGRNVFAGLDGVAPTVGLESIIDLNPEVILVVRANPEDDFRMVWNEWPQLDAVANDRVYPIDANLVSRAGPRMIEGAAQICSALADASQS